MSVCRCNNFKMLSTNFKFPVRYMLCINTSWFWWRSVMFVGRHFFQFYQKVCVRVVGILHDHTDENGMINFIDLLATLCANHSKWSPTTNYRSMASSRGRFQIHTVLSSTVRMVLNFTSHHFSHKIVGDFPRLACRFRKFTFLKGKRIKDQTFHKSQLYSVKNCIKCRYK